MSYSEDIIRASNCDLPWDKLSGCNILVTGATGLIGGCLVNILMSQTPPNYHIYAMGRNKQRMDTLSDKYDYAKNFHSIIGDVTKPLSSNIPFHYIVHAASGAAPSEFTNHPVEVMKANLLGVSNLLEYGLYHQMRRFLYVSSGEVYGEGDGRIFTEDYSGYVNPTSPRSCYPSSKRAAETLCVSYAAEYSADVVIARPCHVYGPHFTEQDNRVYAQFIRNVLHGEDIVMKSTGTQYRSWCYVVDCASALLYILLKGESGHAYNIADRLSNITIKELADMIAGLEKKNVIIDVASSEERKGYNPVKKSVFSTQKLEKLGWQIEGNMLLKMQHTMDERKNKPI